jgi:hypothetical protein
LFDSLWQSTLDGAKALHLELAFFSAIAAVLRKHAGVNKKRSAEQIGGRNDLSFEVTNPSQLRRRDAANTTAHEYEH